MLSQSSVHPTLSVTDLGRAKKFYGETLGLRSNGDIVDGHAEYEAGNGTILLIYERPDPPKAENTVASFVVDNVEETVKLLLVPAVQIIEENAIFVCASKMSIPSRNHRNCCSVISAPTRYPAARKTGPKNPDCRTVIPIPGKSKDNTWLGR